MKLRGRHANVRSIDVQRKGEEGTVPREFEDCEPTPERQYLQQELREVLTTSISQLPSAYRSVFELRAVDGFSTEETAHALDLSRAAVKSRLRRARLQLRLSLSQRFKSTGEIHTCFEQACPAASRLPVFSDARFHRGAG